MASLTWRPDGTCYNHKGEEVARPPTDELPIDELSEGVSCMDGEGWADTRPADAPSRVFDDREPLPPFDDWEPTPPAPFDAVKNPPHYAQYEIQPITFILKNNIGYAAGNVIKYVCRHNLKEGLQDLEKAREYIDIMIADYKEKQK